MRTVRKYDKEFRINGVKHYESSGKKVKEVAGGLEIPDCTLNHWVWEY